MNTHTEGPFANTVSVKTALLSPWPSFAEFAVIFKIKSMTGEAPESDVKFFGSRMEAAAWYSKMLYVKCVRGFSFECERYQMGDDLIPLDWSYDNA